AVMADLGDATRVVRFDEPLELAGVLPDGERLGEMRLGADGVLAVIENALTLGRGHAEIRLLLDEAKAGRFDGAWPAALEEWLWLTAAPECSSLAQALIECRDNPPLRRERLADALARYPQWRAVLAAPEPALQLCGYLGVKPAPLRASRIDVPV